MVDESKKGGPAEGGPAAFGLPEGFENDATAQLVEKAKSGDSDALNMLFSRYQSTMVEVARRRLGPRLRMKEEPDDLAQTTFREATRDFANYEYRGEGSLLKWLIQILQNKIRDKAEFYSARKRDSAMETPLSANTDTDAPIPEPSSPDLSVTRMVQRDERVGILQTALEQLTPEYRKAITLVFFEGNSLREAGESMGGRSEDAVRMMLRRAESKLGSLLRAASGGDPDVSRYG